MSAVRTELADAVNTVFGLTCSAYFVQPTSPGMAFIRLDRIDYPNKFGGEAYWSVVVMCPTDQARAEKYLEQNVPLVIDALAGHLVITTMTPDRIPTDAGTTVPVFVIQGHRED